MFATLLAMPQQTEGQEGQLVIRGGWLFDSICTAVHALGSGGWFARFECRGP
jgi:hypothetical protein